MLLCASVAFAVGIPSEVAKTQPATKTQSHGESLRRGDEKVIPIAVFNAVIEIKEQIKLSEDMRHFIS